MTLGQGKEAREEYNGQLSPLYFTVSFSRRVADFQCFVVSDDLKSDSVIHIHIPVIFSFGFHRHYGSKLSIISSATE